VFIYLHQYASLVDTRKSLQGYFKTRMPADHELEMKTYHLDSLEALEQYWIDLKHFAFSSNLGHKCMYRHSFSSNLGHKCMYRHSFSSNLGHKCMYRHSFLLLV
jgi:hypothetical protein